MTNEDTGPIKFFYEADFKRLENREDAAFSGRPVVDFDGDELKADWENYSVTLQERPLFDASMDYVDDVWCVRCNDHDLPIYDINEDSFAGYKDFSSREEGIAWLTSKGLIRP